MKIAMILFSLLLSQGASAQLNGFNRISCAYTQQGTVKKPIVTLSTKYKGNEPIVTLSVAYVWNGSKVIENATVTSAGYTENYEGYGVTAVTTSGKTVDISIYIQEGSNESWISVNGQPQEHMNNLKCNFATAG